MTLLPFERLLFNLLKLIQHKDLFSNCPLTLRIGYTLTYFLATPRVSRSWHYWATLVINYCFDTYFIDIIGLLWLLTIVLTHNFIDTIGLLWLLSIVLTYNFAICHILRNTWFEIDTKSSSYCSLKFWLNFIYQKYVNKDLDEIFN